ncbi:unnamed protein product [Taenia asiatica]|uniref:Uncharacterized protein n=1 Tax=Taenia asiatica TaxID=60517 RepID=A0A0R3W075_TAEAS|nr:unnamed protein product [Taenia asiatica]
MKDIDVEHDCSKRLLTLPVPHIDDNHGVPFSAEVRNIHLLVTMPMAHTHTPLTERVFVLAPFKSPVDWTSLVAGGVGKQLSQSTNTTVLTPSFIPASAAIVPNDTPYKTPVFVACKTASIGSQSRNTTAVSAFLACETEPSLLQDNRFSLSRLYLKLKDCTWGTTASIRVKIIIIDFVSAIALAVVFIHLG